MDVGMVVPLRGGESVSPFLLPFFTLDALLCFRYCDEPFLFYLFSAHDTATVYTLLDSLESLIDLVELLLLIFCKLLDKLGFIRAVGGIHYVTDYVIALMVGYFLELFPLDGGENLVLLLQEFVLYYLQGSLVHDPSLRAEVYSLHLKYITEQRLNIK